MGGCAAAGRTVQQYHDKHLYFAYVVQEWSDFREWGMIIIGSQSSGVDRWLVRMNDADGTLSGVWFRGSAEG